MKSYQPKYIVFLLIFISSVLSGQQRFTISGYVRDASTGEELIGANIAIEETGSGTITNQYGYYSLSLKPG
ncbi:MAG TPA: carboxypeptidase-like regulatory domain-containing protein, partial [Bacteroidales bacterium]|nr:carboxypeptidase-like regulatory domain-containing protein [Bacteroidales bacterium]